ncbi:hypothetical protein [Kribbella deserti]|uniref:DUF4167 domain-containing protein n=1 Tax=Kribbella deserti TaxID=1926257 RepID=A0ABV6QJU2_9ACTN
MPDFDDDELNAELEGPEPEALRGPTTADESPDKTAAKVKQPRAPRLDVQREVALEPTPPQLAVPLQASDRPQAPEKPRRQDLRQEAAAARNIAYADRGLAHELRAGAETPADLDRAEQLQGSADHYDRMAAADDAEAVYPHPADGSQPPPGGAVQTPPGKSPKARKSVVRGKGRSRGFGRSR